MGKKNVMISIDENVLIKFDNLKFNRSNFCENAMRSRLHTNKKDMPEEDLKLKCAKCGALVDDGFFCELRKRFFCVDCESTMKCFLQQHEHIRIPGYAGETQENKEFRKEIVTELKKDAQDGLK